MPGTTLNSVQTGKFRQRHAETRVQYLRLVLRFGGCVLAAAFLAMLLPVDWMAGTHEWLGLGEFPRRPLVDYLARSVAALYGFHGILLFIVAGDPQRYEPIVRYLVFMNVTLGAMLVAVDLHAGLPMLWTLLEGPPLVVTGVLIEFLSRGLRDKRS